MRLLLAWIGALAVVAHTSAQRQTEPEELLSRYERGAFEQFDASLRIFAALPLNAKTFTRAVDRWIDAGPASARRRLVAAAVTVELAAALGNWNAAPVILDAGRGWLQSGDAGDLSRHWYRAAIGAALAHGDTKLVLASRDVQPDSSRMLPEYREYVNRALRQYRDDPGFMLLKAIAFELLSATGGQVQWLDRDAVERRARSIQRGPDGGGILPLPTNARMDVASAERLLRPDVVDLPGVRSVAEMSLRLWDVARRFRDLQQDPVIGAEATLRLAVTYNRLARPDLAARELERLLDVSAGPFVTYTVYFLRGRTLEQAARPDARPSPSRLGPPVGGRGPDGRSGAGSSYG